MSEKLMNASTILLFGRLVQDVQIVAATDAKDPKPVPRHSANSLLQNEVAQATGQPKRGLARIYAFSYEGHYYDLSKPALFVVHGPGDSPVTPAAEHTGLAASVLEFAPDVRVWAYDKSDLSIRLDIETGTFDQILLEGELRADRARPGASGYNVRLSTSGYNVRLRGNRDPSTE